jgi:hypothetical protein
VWAGVGVWAAGVAIGAAVTIAAATHLRSNWELFGLVVIPLGVLAGVRALPRSGQPRPARVGAHVRTGGGAAAVILGAAVAHSAPTTQLLVGGYLTGFVGAALVVALAHRYR